MFIQNKKNETIPNEMPQMMGNGSTQEGKLYHVDNDQIVMNNSMTLSQKNLE